MLAHFPDDRRSAVWWYDAALAHKFLRNWAKAYQLGREAAARAPRGEGDPAYWNLGIAATIQRDWATAREAWTGFGIELPDGEGEIRERFGPACVRPDSGGEREVVWIDRLCPTRGRVMNVPVTGGRRFGEIVVHDGEPKGERVVDGMTFPVFDELLLFEASELPTLAVTVHAGTAADMEALTGLFVEHGYGAEPASRCRSCVRAAARAPWRGSGGSGVCTRAPSGCAWPPPRRRRGACWSAGPGRR
ncbi:tetratricopeptide repeat protein [Streptomyces sp. NPDC051636]|uniref:tetratricopeptide repeat protein n=1 Tax=Streptomyces sp. NPDC051636 TaxID=3365663 RepID=UPI0037A85C97